MQKQESFDDDDRDDLEFTGASESGFALTGLSKAEITVDFSGGNKFGNHGGDMSMQKAGTQKDIYSAHDEMPVGGGNGEQMARFKTSTEENN